MMPVKEIQYDGHIIIFKDNVSNITAAANNLGAKYRIPVDNIFNVAIKGFSTKIPINVVSMIMSREANIIKSIEPDYVVSAYVQDIPWGVTRIGVDTGSPDFVTDAKSVHVFVLDTGSTHSDLNIVEKRSFIKGEKNVDDLNWHGTAVAGCVAAINNDSFVLGVAPSASIHSYKVLGRKGTGLNSNVIAGIDQVIKWKLANPNIPCVINLSLGSKTGTTATALDTVVQSAINTNITCVVAAGNDGADAKDYSPAHVDDAITVGAYNDQDKISNFSNYGPKVDILAPGENVKTLYINESMAFVSGTSFSAPYVAGAVALILYKNPTYTPAEVRAELINLASNPENNPINVNVYILNNNTTNLSVYVKPLPVV